MIVTDFVVDHFSCLSKKIITSEDLHKGYVNNEPSFSVGAHRFHQQNPSHDSA